MKAVEGIDKVIARLAWHTKPQGGGLNQPLANDLSRLILAYHSVLARLTDLEEVLRRRDLLPTPTTPGKAAGDSGGS